MSWHGILLSESARLAPVGRAGSVTGGVLSFGQMGAFLCPSVFSLLLRVTGGYAAGWAVCAIPAVLVGIEFACAKGRVEHGGWCEVTHACPTMAWHDRCQRQSDDHQERSCQAAGICFDA